jgi:excisionase family DNA binding protein
MQENGVENEPVVYLSMESAAKRLGCSSPTVRRVAKSRGLGILADGERIVAVAEHELPLLKPYIHATSGNPVWIAAAKKKRPGKRSRPH